MSQFNLSWPAGVQANFQTTLDSIMNNIEGRQCILTFPPITQPITAGQSLGPGFAASADIWTVGTPLPVGSQQSYGGYCDGNSLIEVESTGIITMVVYTNPSQFNRIFPIGQRHEDNMIMTRGFVKDLQDIMNCVRMNTYLDVPNTHYDFKLAGEPVMPGTLIPSRYFYTLWSRL